MKTLAIETSCDDTSLALVSYKDGFFDVEKCILHSQIAEHTRYGGVVPELASRLHEQKVVDLLDEIWLENIKKVHFISYTSFPGLPWSLLVWKTLANTLSLFLEKEKVWIHHIQGHIFSILADRNINDIIFPMITLTVSWWHNNLYLIAKSDYKSDLLDDFILKLQKNYNLIDEDLIQELGSLKIYKIGWTLDDAAWECFDKVSRMLNWPYPWWWWISDLSDNYKNNIDEDIKFPRIWLKKDEFNFSFSWLKAQVNYKVQDLKKKYGEELSESVKQKVAKEFEEATVETLWKKLLKAAKHFSIENVSLVGGVSANTKLKKYIKENKEKFGVNNFYTPEKNLYSTDNAAMIWVVGLLKHLN